MGFLGSSFNICRRMYPLVNDYLMYLSIIIRIKCKRHCLVSFTKIYYLFMHLFIYCCCYCNPHNYVDIFANEFHNKKRNIIIILAGQ